MYYGVTLLVCGLERLISNIVKTIFVALP